MHGKSQDFLSKMHGNEEKLVNCIAYLAILANNASGLGNRLSQCAVSEIEQ